MSSAAVATTVQEVQAACDHRESADPRKAGACVKCSYRFPPWYLTVEEARQFYEAIGLADLADEGITRLTGPAAAEYSWTAYLTRDNAAGGIEEQIDSAHYAFFDELVLRMLEREGEVSEDDARVIRHELFAAARASAEAIRHFQVVRRLLKR